MRASDVGRRGLILGLLATTAGGAAAQFARAPGRSAAFRAGFRYGDRTTIRAAYEVTGVPASNAGFTSVVRWGEANRLRLVIRNPANSGGNVVLGTKSAASNNAIDTGNVGTTTYTLAPGQELVDEGGTGAWLVRSDQSSVPAGTYLSVEAEIA